MICSRTIELSMNELLITVTGDGTRKARLSSNRSMPSRCMYSQKAMKTTKMTNGPVNEAMYEPMPAARPRRGAGSGTTAS
jgi:hypothetical protein